ncbi:TetR/AcrR family transcriptional regulator [Streptomyces sp. NRRL S-118]|uniref:TetR/AcrR family transcriptional regulator n=1 Tax=Streptomyces sp. NRRL S-118 TaxID=1463881 RepID=UPI0004C82C46|nr:TetR/AcrR family transcriptional regulator [Streptomyces sp. NRRL S-118]
MTPRAELIADTALALLAERGMRGLTHRAVDERAGLPQGSTSNHARTRQALLEAAVRRLADREAQVLGPDELPSPGPAGSRAGAGDGSGADTGPDAGSGPDGGSAGGASDPGAGLDAVLDALSLALHRYLTHHRDLLVARYELALEATRRPELRGFYDTAGRRFREPLTALMRAAGSAAPDRHTLSLVAWAEGLMFSCAVGSFHATVPDRAELRAGLEELLRGMLGR